NLDSHGASIFLYNINGVITGSTAASAGTVDPTNTIFTIGVNGSGVVTLTQFAQIDHPIAQDPSATQAPFDDQLAVLGSNLVTLTASATITDFDNDSATDSATVDLGGNIKFADHGPSIDVAAGSDTGVVLTTQDADTIGANFDTAASVADFSGVFSIASSAFGADGPGTAPALSYVLDVVAAGEDSNLDSHGASIFLYNINGVITGSTAASAGTVDSTNTIFTIGVNGPGVVTLTQFAQIDHPIAQDPSATQAPFDDQLAILGSNLVTLTASATITDFDNDTATDSATVDLGGNIKFADHGPSIDVAAGSDTGVVLTTQDALTIGAAFDTAVSTANFGGVFSIGNASYGADGAGTTTALGYTLNVVTQGEDSTLDSHGASIFLYNIGGVIEGSTS